MNSLTRSGLCWLELEDTLQRRGIRCPAKRFESI